jgi:hypothetical protein
MLYLGHFVVPFVVIVARVVLEADVVAELFLLTGALPL